MGAFSLPIGLTGNLFNLWGLTPEAESDEPVDPRVEPVVEPRAETPEDTAGERAGTQAAGRQGAER